MADTLRLVRPTGLTAKLRKVPAELRKVLKYIFAELCDLLCETLRLKKSSYETADTLRFVRPTSFSPFHRQLYNKLRSFSEFGFNKNSSFVIIRDNEKGN